MKKTNLLEILNNTYQLNTINFQFSKVQQKLILFLKKFFFYYFIYHYILSNKIYYPKFVVNDIIQQTHWEHKVFDTKYDSYQALHL